MKVWVDGSAFENNRQHGVWRVFFEIMSRTSNDVEYTLGLRDIPQRPIPAGVQVFQDLGRRQLAPHQLLDRWRRRQELRSDPPELRKVNLFHSTGFTSPIDSEIRSVTTVHDLIAESHFPICIQAVEEGIPIKSKSLERAVALPCVSETTKQELVSFYPHLESRASVVTHGYEHLLASRTELQRSVVARAYALFVGMRMGYKNFRVILDAMACVDWPKTVALDVVGPPFSDAEKLLIKKVGLASRITHLGTVTDDQLRSLYRDARCLIFPSFQEGFGLPCLEAQANNCPLLCSDIDVFHEVAADAALYFDPRLGESLAEQVDRVGEPTRRKELLERGQENLLRFSWDKSAQQMLEVYDRAINGRL